MATLSVRIATFEDLPDIKKCNERNLHENYDIDTVKEMIRGHLRNSYVLTDSTGVIVGYIMCSGSDLLSFAIDRQYKHVGYDVILYIILRVRCENLVGERFVRKQWVYSINNNSFLFVYKNVVVII